MPQVCYAMTEKSSKAEAMGDKTASSLRDKQQELSRNLAREVILRALADVIVEQGVHDFSVQTVADRAGVSHRTVYRHFASRDELLRELYLWLDDRLDRLELPDFSNNAWKIPEAITSIFRALDEEDRMVRAVSIVGLTTDHQTDQRRLRTADFHAALRELAPDLDEDAFSAQFAVIRSLAAAQQWFILRQQFGLSGDLSGPAVARAITVLLEDLVARNEEARQKTEEDQ